MISFAKILFKLFHNDFAWRKKTIFGRSQKDNGRNYDRQFNLQNTNGRKLPMPFKQHLQWQQNLKKMSIFFQYKLYFKYCVKFLLDSCPAVNH